MERIFQNLESIKSWTNKPLPQNLKSNDDYMNFIMDLISYAHYLVKISVSMATNQEKASRGYTKHKAIIIGHQVRLLKLFHGFGECGTASIKLDFDILWYANYLLSKKGRFLFRIPHQE